jgi:FkbM family methyltransferase
MNKRIVNISRSGLLRKTFRTLRFHKLYNYWLEHFPRTKVLGHGNVIYRCRRTESVSLALEMLEGGDSYDVNLLPDNYSTFADLGCNVGFFACLLAFHAKGRRIRGIMVDANPAVLSEARWHVQKNNWLDVFVMEGLIGDANQTGKADFFVNEADTCSMAQLGEAQAKDIKGFKRITTPVLSFGREWARKMGDQRCHVLKIDIEGSELEFFQSEVQFLKLVDSIFVEWHTHRVSFKELDSFLTSQGFCLVKIIEDLGTLGTAFYNRQQV